MKNFQLLVFDYFDSWRESYWKILLKDQNVNFEVIPSEDILYGKLDRSQNLLFFPLAEEADPILLEEIDKIYPLTKVIFGLYNYEFSVSNILYETEESKQILNSKISSIRNSSTIELLTDPMDLWNDIRELRKLYKISDINSSDLWELIIEERNPNAYLFENNKKPSFLSDVQILIERCIELSEINKNEIYQSFLEMDEIGFTFVWEVPDLIKIPFQQYLLNFNKFIRTTKKYNKPVYITDDEKGIRINLKEIEPSDYQIIKEYLCEYVELILKDPFEPIFTDIVSREDKENLLEEISFDIKQLKERIEFISKRTEELKPGIVYKKMIEISSSTKNIEKSIEGHRNQISGVNKNIDNLKEIIEDISESQFQDIIHWIDLAFNSSEIKNLENFIELEDVLNGLKNSSNWETKIKIAIPLLNFIGIKIESESKFNLKDHLMSIKSKAEELAIKYGG